MPFRSDGFLIPSSESPHTHTHANAVHPSHSESHPRDIFLPHHVQRAAQRSVASLCTSPSSSRHFFHHLLLSFSLILFVPLLLFLTRPFPILFSSRLVPSFLSSLSCLLAKAFLPFLAIPSRLVTLRAETSSVSKVSPTSSKYANFSYFPDFISQGRICT